MHFLAASNDWLCPVIGFGFIIACLFISAVREWFSQWIEDRSERIKLRELTGRIQHIQLDTYFSLVRQLDHVCQEVETRQEDQSPPSHESISRTGEPIEAVLESENRPRPPEDPRAVLINRYLNRPAFENKRRKHSRGSKR